MPEETRRPPRRPGGPGRGNGEKPKNFGAAIKRLLKFLKPFYSAIIIALLFAVVATVCSVIGPSIMEDLTNTISAAFEAPSATNLLGAVHEMDMETVLFYCFVLLAIYGVSMVCSMTQGIIMATVTQKNARNMREAISKKINQLPLKYFDSNTTGDTLSLVTNDVDTIGQTLNQSISTFVSAVVMLIGCLIMMFVTNWIMAFAALAASLIGFSFVFLIMSRSQKYFAQQQQSLGDIDGHIEEVYAGHNVVKVYNADRKVKNTFDGINKTLYASAWKSQFLGGIMQPLMGFVGNLGYVAVCVVGAALLANGVIESGVIVAFMLYVRLFTSPLSQIAQAFTSMQSAAAASERVFAFLDQGILPDESGKTVYLEPSTVRGDVTFDHVRFGYDSSRVIIHDFSAEVKAGQKIAIVGPTGAGKTTMVNLLMRFYEVNDGSIRIDGVPVSDLKRENIHDLFGMVLQDTWLFNGTIRENIVYSKENVTDDQLEKAADAVGLSHYVSTLPNGYDTVLDEKANLSAGQKQLVTIARAMIEDAPMLILDEATSSVDTRTEIQIQEAMDRLTEGRTSFIIAHRLSTIKNADLILVMKDGDIIESGNHTELLAEGGFYAELYNSQFEE